MYEYKDLYIIDLTDVKTYYEFHFAIRDSLNFPDYYGCNWDAFWDCLTDMVGRPVNMEIRGFDIFVKRFGAEFSDEMLEILDEFKHYNNDRYSNQIKIRIIRGDTVEELQ